MSADLSIRKAGLTEIDLWILRESARGASNTEIALRLFLYESAVRERFRDICRKIGAATRAEAVAWLRKQQQVGMLEDQLDPLQELRRWGTVNDAVVESQGQDERGPNLHAVVNGHGPAVQPAHT